MNPASSTLENEVAVSPYGTRWTRWIRPIGLSFLLIFLDGLGVFAVLLGAILILIYLPRSLLAKKYATCRKERLVRFSIYLSAVGVVLVLIPINKQIGEERAEKIIAAVESYKVANGKYPDRLDQLAPQFIAEIPAKARISFADIGFRYHAGNEGRPTLMYLAMPPFGRRIYSFATKSWGFID